MNWLISLLPSFMLTFGLVSSSISQQRHSRSATTEATLTRVVDEMKGKPKLTELFDNWMKHKGLKYQRKLSHSKRAGTWQMSISYDDNETTLYDLYWEVDNQSVKFTSPMKNKLKEPLKFSFLDNDKLLKLLLMINNGKFSEIDQKM